MVRRYGREGRERRPAPTEEVGLARAPSGSFRTRLAAYRAAWGPRLPPEMLQNVLTTAYRVYFRQAFPLSQR